MLVQQRHGIALKPPPVPPPTGPSELYGSVRTALAIEPRDDHLWVFLPPVEDALDFAALVAAVEEAAAAMKLPVRIEGYPPPNDPRLNVIKVTPDPGVIEVNIHPATNWKELVGITTAVYEESHKVRLGTEKFLIDGRHTGTGGGNHIVMGGIDAGRQPLPAPPRPRRIDRHLLAEPPVALLPVLRPLHRARRARRRVSTRRATSRSTSWRSRSSRFPIRAAAACTRGSSTASSGICSST